MTETTRMQSIRRKEGLDVASSEEQAKKCLLKEYCKSNDTADESDSFPSLDESCISLDTSMDPTESQDTSSHFFSSFADDVGTMDRPLFDDSYMSVDPFYSFSAEELHAKVEATQTRCSCDDFITLSLAWISSRMFPSLSSVDLDESVSSK
jgi:hypothetical protein